MMTTGFTPRTSAVRVRERPSGIPEVAGDQDSDEGTKKAPPVDPTWTVDAATGCWNWDGAPSQKGYGRVWLGRGEPRVAAHRWVYEDRVGPIADGVQLDHLCRNRICVNPAHMEQVTNEVNVQRGGGTKLTPETVREIRSKRERLGTIYADLAHEFGISTMQAWKIVNRQSWRNVA